MLRWAADENFDNDIVRGVQHRNSAVDIVRVQDVGLAGAEDPDILEWAADVGRILLTHDVATMTRFAYDRVRQGKPMSGVFEVGGHIPIGIAIDEIVLVAECSLEGEYEGQVRYLPLR